jgi:hypothetical protein
MQLPFTVVFEPPRVAAHWDEAHGKALVTVPGAATVGTLQTEYWLVRFHLEAKR